MTPIKSKCLYCEILEQKVMKLSIKRESISISAKTGYKTLRNWFYQNLLKLKSLCQQLGRLCKNMFIVRSSIRNLE